MNLTVRKRLAKLSFPCQNAGTAKLLVRYGRHRWTSATKRYACSQAQANASVRVTKSVARRLSKASHSVVASLLIKDGTAKKSLPVILPTALRGKPTGHAAQSDPNFWGTEPKTVCSRYDHDDGNGPIGSVTTNAPYIEIFPPAGDHEWFAWRSWLKIYDGRSNQFSPWVPIPADSYDRGEFMWHNGWIDLDQLTNLPWTIQPGTESLGPIYPGYDAYVITAGQSVIYLDGAWHWGPVKLFHPYSTWGELFGDFCHFP